MTSQKSTLYLLLFYAFPYSWWKKTIPRVIKSFGKSHSLSTALAVWYMLYKANSNDILWCVWRFKPNFLRISIYGVMSFLLYFCTKFEYLALNFRGHILGNKSITFQEKRWEKRREQIFLCLFRFRSEANIASIFMIKSQHHNWTEWLVKCIQDPKAHLSLIYIYIWCHTISNDRVDLQQWTLQP